MGVIFISHSDSWAANELEDVLRSSFPGEVEVFNTSRAASGLAAGESIDVGVLSHIRDAHLIIWLASPRSVQQSFWMAWELGAATAYEKVLIPVRCLGLQPERLPLLQGGRNSPDIGLRSGMNQLLDAVKRTLVPTGERIAEVLRQRFDEADIPSSLWGRKDEDRITMRIFGDRILIENQSQDNLTFEPTKLSSRDASSWKAAVSRGLRKLGPGQRLILDLGTGHPINSKEDIRLMWQAELDGRFWSDVHLSAE